LHQKKLEQTNMTTIRFISLKEARQREGNTCRTKQWDLIRQNRYPRPVVRDGRKFIVESEHDAYLAALVAARDAEVV
jgi:predicted DNA-binding transcriptional regulator AlpA